MRRNYDDEAEEYETRRTGGPEAAANWFHHGTQVRTPNRLRAQGVTADWLLGELVRRPGDPSRNSATSMTQREPQDVDQTPPGEGEWHGGGKLRPDVTRRNDAEAPYASQDRRHARFAQDLNYFQQRLLAEGRHPELQREINNAAAEHYGMGFTDRGRRYTATDNTEPEPQEPRPRHQNQPFDETPSGQGHLTDVFGQPMARSYYR
jgi:hypothetical protein